MPLNRRQPSQHLVCQHLERISRRVLERYQDIIRDYVRGRHGIYVLFREGELYYIGLATDLRTRLTQHLRDRHGISWDQFSIYLTIQDSHLKELESLLLRIIRPPGNRQSGKLPRSEDLHARFKSDIQVFQQLELNNLLGKTIKTRIQTKDATSPNADENAPVLAKYRNRPVLIQGRHKNRILKATVLKNGAIRFQGKIYNSPSKAAAAAVQRRTCNGWTFWLYQRAPGDWVQLDKLRK